MIRRFYIMPLNAGVSEADIAEMIHGFDECDRFLPGLFDSAAGLDTDNRTVIWENNFVDLATYSGAYMTEPYHACTLDEYLMGDSPRCFTHDTFTVRYEAPDTLPRLEKGVRRLVIMKLPEGADTSAIEALAAKPDGMATSAFYKDTVGWVSAKGRSWTHVWDQGFADVDALNRYLKTPDGISGSSVDGLKRLNVDVEAVKVFTYPFALKPAQSPGPTGAFPTYYTITVRLAHEDVEAYLALIKECYDPYVAGAGGKLVHRWRSVENGYPEAEVHSTWELQSIAAYNDVRLATGSDGWKRFVREAMPLVKSGARRFYRAV
jgi:hypothetical protein